MPRLTVALFGGFRVQLASGHLLSFSTKKAQALLAYLAVRPGQAHPRDKLAALLWPDTSNEQARQNLRQALAALRRILPSGRRPMLQADGETLALDATGLSVDVVEFERHLARGTADSLARAAQLYRGDLLEGLRVTEPPFEEWLQAERDRLRQRAFQGLTRLLTHQERAGPVEMAIETARRLLALDPLQESVHCQLIRLHARQGRLGEARRQYDACVRALAQELGTAPAPATRALYESLRQQPAGWPALDGTRRASRGHGRSSGAAMAPGALIGRDEALRKLDRAMDEVWQGRGRVALVVGEAGVGKSRLIEEMAARMERRGGSTLVGRCYESEQILPFGPWVDALRSWRRAGLVEDPAELVPVWRDELTRLLPELGRPGAPLPAGTRDHLRLFEAMAELVLTLGSRRPWLLVIEDLHWSDELSQRLLAFISRRLADARVLLVGTAREEELAGGSLLVRVMSEMREKAGALDVPLGPLSRGDTDRLVQALTGGGDDEAGRRRLEDRVWRVSEGNPFTVLETIRALQEGGGAGALAGLTVPERVREVILGRVARLPDRERRVMAVASVIGREFDLRLLARGAGLSVATATKAAETLRERGLLVSRSDRLDVTHDRIRAAIAGDLLPARRRLLNRAVAQAMEALYAEDLAPHCAALGTHYREAEAWEKAVVYLRQAGRAALAHAAHREALVLFEQALAALGHLTQTRDRMEQAWRLRCYELRLSLFPLAERRHILTHLREARTLAEALGDPLRLALVYVHLANEHWMCGDQAGALESVRQAQVLGQDLQDRELSLTTTFRLGQIQHTLGQYTPGVESLRSTTASLQPSERRRVFNVAPLYVLASGWLAWSLAELGEFEEAIARGREGLEIVEEMKNAYGIAHACFTLGRAYVLRGEPGAACQVLERGLEVCHMRDLPVLSVVNRGELGYAHVVAGRIEHGVTLLVETVEQAGAIGVEFTRALYLAWLGEAYARAGQSDLALDSARRALDLATSRGERGHEAYAHRALGLAARQDRTGDDQAARHFQDALDLGASLGMRPLVAHCRLDLGKLHRRGRDRARAAEHLTAAAALFSEMKMTLWREEAESELSAPGADGTRPREDRPPAPAARGTRRRGPRSR